ncbi:MAG: hypothetical protein GY756_17650 [bacterium]|nr:hypothetical protein [bacterium]
MKKNYFLIVLATIAVITLSTGCKKFVTKTVYSDPQVENVTHNSVSVSTEIREVGAELDFYGHCYSTQSNPTIDDLKTEKSGMYAEAGDFTEEIIELSPNTTYYIRAYAIEGEIRYSSMEQSFTTDDAPSPIVKTIDAGSIGPTKATLNGKVNANGCDATVYFEYGETTNYGTIENASPVTSNSIEDISASITGLTEGQTYHFRIAASNEYGTSLGEDMTFVARYIPEPTIETTEAGSISSTGATLNGVVNALDNSATVIFEYGPTDSYGITAVASPGIVEGNVNENVIAVVSDLAENTTYHYRVVATNAGGTIRGNDMSFTASNSSQPTVTTNSASEISETTAYINGLINANGSDATVVFQYGTDSNYGTNVNASPGTVLADEGNTNITAYLTNLTADQTYHYRVYATNNNGTSYGEDMTFKASNIPIPTVLTVAQSNVGKTSATLNGKVNANEFSTSVSFEYGTTLSYGTTLDAVPQTVIGTSNNDVSLSLSNLAPNTTYNFRVIAENNGGISIGDNISFTTEALEPTATIEAADPISQTTATLNGQVNANGADATVSFEYGLSISYGSEIAAKEGTITGTTDKSASADITGLTVNTTYHYRIKAVNSGGTKYSNDLTFTTTSKPTPTVLTIVQTNVEKTTATLNGQVNANGYDATVTFEYGITTSYGNSISADPANITGTTNKSVKADLSNLTENTTYNFRVVAQNEGGTSYGDNISFKTDPLTPSIITQAADNILLTTARLNGVVNPNGDNTTVTFEYGETTLYGSTINAVPNTINGSSNTTDVYADISSLNTNTTYHFRLVAENNGGTSDGDDNTFTTQTHTINISSPTSGNDWNMGTQHNITWSDNIAENIKIDLYKNSIFLETIVSSTISNGTYLWDIPKTYTEGSDYQIKLTSISDGSITSTSNTFSILKYNLTLTDIDGNNYNTVQIGTQIWMAENLKTTKYTNGDIIPNGKGAGDISAETNPKYWFAYNDDLNNVSTYGRLYTWHTASDSRNICPVNWHVPTNNEWTIMENYLITNGYNYDGTISGNKIAKALGSTEYWTPYSNVGSVGNTDYPTYRNKTGFTALPSGYRGADGIFFGKGEECYLWSTSISGQYVICHTLSHTSYIFNTALVQKSRSNPVRCIKD